MTLVASASEEETRRAGAALAARLAPSAVRFSLGLEDVEDLIEDLRQALATL